MRLKRPSPALVISCLALAVALGGSGYAAVKLNGSQLVNRSVAGVKVKKDTLGKTEIKEASIAAVTPVFNMQRGPYTSGTTSTFKTKGGSIVIQVSGSGYTAAGFEVIGLDVVVDGLTRGRVKSFTNEAGSHKAFVTTGIPVTGLKAGTHSITLKPFGGTSTDQNDFLTVTVFEGAVALGKDELEDGDDTQAGAPIMDICLNSAMTSWTMFPANDNDWRYSGTTGGNAGTTIEFVVIGGPTMDVYAHNGTTRLAKGVKTFNGPAYGQLYDVRVHGPKVQTYVMKCRLIFP